MHRSRFVPAYRRSTMSRMRSSFVLMSLLIMLFSGLLPLAPVQARPKQAAQAQPPSAPVALDQPVAQTSSASVAAEPFTPGPDDINVAVGKTATQTNEHTSVADPYPGGLATNAIDGNTDGFYNNGSVTHTWGNNHDQWDWWEVDLRGIYSIGTIQLWNRTDCCLERLHDFYVMVSDTPFVSNDLTAIKVQDGVSAFFTSGLADVATAIAVNRTGRYVRVILTEPGILSLAEVQVWSKSFTPLDRPAKLPTAVATPLSQSVKLNWLPLRVAASYTIQRATTRGGPYTTIATGVTSSATVGSTTMFEYLDTGLVNRTPYYYVVTAIGTSGLVRGTSPEVLATPRLTLGHNALAPIPAVNASALAGVSTVSDATLGRSIVTGVDVGDYLMFRAVNFGTGANGVRVRYNSQSSHAGSIVFSTLPSDDGIIATVPITSTGLLPTWSSASEIVTPTSGTRDLYVRFQGLGSNLLDLDQIQFFAPGPYDTADVKWDPNLVLLHKAMGITMTAHGVSDDGVSLAMTFSASTAQGRAQFDAIKVGSTIASDTNLDLGGPYGRVNSFVRVDTATLTVAIEFMTFNEMVFGGAFDATGLFEQAFISAVQGLNGTSALGPGYTTAGYESRMPTVTYYDGATGQDSGSSASGATGRISGLGAPQGSGSDVPAISVPSEAKGERIGRFHVTLDNAQFVGDEAGVGLELVNLRLNALGVDPLNKPNPVAAANGFGVLGGVGFDTLRMQFKMDEVQPVQISARKNISINPIIRLRAHFQSKGLAVGLWFLELPGSWVKSIPVAIPTPIGPIPSALQPGLQGYFIAVATGNITAEAGIEAKFTGSSDPRKWLAFSEYGERKFELGQRVDNTSLLGFTAEPFVKVRIGTIGGDGVSIFEIERIARKLKMDPKFLDALRGLAVITFTPRMQLLNILKNWKDKEHPIYEFKMCGQIVGKAEAAPGFPLKMTFELRTEGNPICLYHKGWLYYDMKVPPTVQADPETGEAVVNWEVPIISERSNIPNDIRWYGKVPVAFEPGEPVVESTNIADGLLNAATRRFCVIYQRPLNISDSVRIMWRGSCVPRGRTEITLPEGSTYANYVLRVMTEYHVDQEDSPLEDMINCDMRGQSCYTMGVWSEQPFSITSTVDDATFKVNDTQILTNQDLQLIPTIESKVCDEAGKVAKEMALRVSITPEVGSNWVINRAELHLDGVNLNAPMLDGAAGTGEKILGKVQDMSAGSHTLKVIAELSDSNYNNVKRTATYYVTFKAQPKGCGRARPDEFAAVIYEGGPCDTKTTPFSALDVLGNDDAVGTTGLKVVAVSGASLGESKISDDGQLVLYKPSATGIDTLTYTIGNAEEIPSNGVVVPPTTASVLVTNRRADNNDCTPGGPGGPGGPGTGGRTKFGLWGDPHVTTADGKHFDTHALGEFVYLRPRSGQTGLTIQGRQDYWISGKGAAITEAFAVKINGRVLEFRAERSPAVLVDGLSPTSNTIDLGPDASLTISNRYYQIQAGDTRIEIIDSISYMGINIWLTLDGTLEGLLGTPNGNPNDDKQLPDGTPITGTSVSDMMTLSDGWRITDRAESLFTYAAGEGPETFNKANVYQGQLPDAAQLAPYVQQAEGLLTSTCATAGTPPDPIEVENLALDLYLGATPTEIASQLCAYEISGTLTTTNPADAPLVGAHVTMTSPEITGTCKVYTNSAGQYRCTLAPKPGAAAPTVQVTTAGLPAQTVTFATRAPIHETLSQTLDLAVTRPTIRLTVRSFDEVNSPTPGTTVEVRTAGVTRQVITGADATATLVLSYEPGTNTASVNATPLTPAYGITVTSPSVTLSQTGPVDLSINLKHHVLDTPAWVRTATPNTSTPFIPIVASSSPAVGTDGTIYTIGYQYERSGNAYRLVATNPNGTSRWVSSTRFGPEDDIAPSIGPDGTIYVLTRGASANSELYAFNPDGSLKWTFTTPADYAYTSQTPAIGADGTLYFVSATYSNTTARLYAINPAGGTPVWTVDLNDSYTESSPVIGPDGTIYVPSGHLRAFAPSGTLLRTSTALTDDEGVLSLGPDGTIYVSKVGNGDSSGSFMQAFNPDLSLRWQQNKGSSHPPVIGTDGGVYLMDYGVILKLNPATGATLWSLPTSGYQAPVVGADGSVYISTQTAVSGLPTIATLIRFDANGTELSRFKTLYGYGYSMTMGPNGTIYTSIASRTNSNGYDLIAIPIASTGPATTWSSAFGNGQNTNQLAP